MNEAFAKVGIPGLICALGLSVSLQTARAVQPPRAVQGRKSAPPSQSAGPKTLTIGDIVITGAQQLKGQFDLSSATVSGPNTVIDVPDKKTGSHLTLHADAITVTGANRPGQGQFEMQGHVRYAVTQRSAEGDRKLNGTSGHGVFRRDTRKLVLSNGVQCELTDPRLDGPASLRARQVTVDIASAAYLYTLDGDAATNDLRFTPRPRSPKLRPETQIGQVHVSHWATAVYQAGKIAQFDGEMVVADLQARAGATRGQLKARHIQGDFAPSGEITQARANVDVHYHIERAVSRKLAEGAANEKPEEGRQEITGTSDEALYEPGARRFTLAGEIDATVVNTLSLAEPARLLASRLVVTEPAVGKDSKDTPALRYEITGAPDHRRLAFTPRPPEPKPAAAVVSAAAPTAAFTMGSIVLTGFQTAVLEPGQKVDVTSDGKQTLLLDTSDPKTHSASHMETHRFTATLAQTGGITDAQTEGPVTFHIQQQGTARAAKTGVTPVHPSAGQIQSLDGNAARAVFKAAGQGRSIALQGPFTARVTDPEHLEAPGSVKGQQNDTLSLDLLSREFTFDSPSETIVLDFTPRTLPEADRAAPNPAPGTRKK